MGSVPPFFHLGHSVVKAWAQHTIAQDWQRTERIFERLHGLLKTVENLQPTGANMVMAFEDPVSQPESLLDCCAHRRARPLVQKIVLSRRLFGRR